MVTKDDILNAREELLSFHFDLCEQLCDGNADCIRECHGSSLKSIGEFIYNIDPQRTTPTLLSEMVGNYKRKHGLSTRNG